MLSMFHVGMDLSSGNHRHRNVWNILSSSIKDIEQHAATNGLVNTKNVCSNLLTSTLPDESQTWRIREMSEHGWFPSGVENLPLYDTAGRERFQIILSRSLTAAYKALNDLHTLVKEMKSPLWQLEENEELKSQAIINFLEVAMKVLTSLADLDDLTSVFSSILGRHLEWLATIFNVDDCLSSRTEFPVRDVTLSSSHKASPSSHQQAAEPETEVEAEASAEAASSPRKRKHNDASPVSRKRARVELSQAQLEMSNVAGNPSFTDASSPAVSKPSTARYVTRDEAQELSDQSDRLGVDEGDEEFELLNLVAKEKGWPAAAKRYLDRIALHVSALRRLRPGNTSRKCGIDYIVKELEVSLLSINMDFEDDVINDLSTVIQYIPFYDRALVLEWFSTLEDLDPSVRNTMQRTPITDSEVAKAAANPETSTNFTGTYHCETTLLSLHCLQTMLTAHPSLAKDLFTQGPNNTSGTYAGPNFTLPKDILEKFKAILPTLASSNRCCPPCDKFIHLLEATFQKQNPYQVYAYPGHHRAWSPTSLPPWIPRQYGKPILDYAIETLKERLELLARLKRAEMWEAREKSHVSVGAYDAMEGYHEAKRRVEFNRSNFHCVVALSQETRIGMRGASCLPGVFRIDPTRTPTSFNSEYSVKF